MTDSKPILQTGSMLNTSEGLITTGALAALTTALTTGTDWRVQAASAHIFGVNGFALALPNALAGVLSIPLLNYLVQRQFGVGAGLAASLVLAVTPVAVSTERNNTIDGLLVFVLLLAVWAVWRSVRCGKLRYLLLGALLVGVGFNIKMLH